VLSVCGGKVSLELCPSFLNAELFIPPATGAHEVPSCNFFGITNIYLMRVPNDNASCFRIISTILNLFEKGLNRLLRVTCAVHLFKIIFQIHSRDVAISHEEMVQHLTRCDVCKTHHVVVYNVQVHSLKNSDDLFSECLLHRGVGAVGINGFFPAVSGCTNLRRSAVSILWCPPGGCWVYPTSRTILCY
jgi:hypothetical protein